MSEPAKSKSGDLEKAAQILKAGGVVIFSTDTVYGIGCRFDDQKAIDRIYQIKGTPQTQPFPILVSSVNQVEKFANINNVAKKLIKKYWPGGLTIILATENGQKLAFRMPNSQLVRTLVEKVGVPIIGTSANFHGQPTPRSYQELDPRLIKLADYTIVGQCQKGIESTVVDTTVTPPKVLREGAVTL